MSESRPPPPAEVECANCGRRFVGSYCPDCGQEDADFERPIRRFLHDLLSDTFAFDARLWRTIPPLLTNPGVLSREYVEGRRARYVPPLRLYVFLAAVFFTVLALTDGGPFRFGVAPGSEGATLESAVGVELGVSAGDLTDRRPGAIGLARAMRDVDRVNGVVVATLSYAHFLLLPVLALFLKALWRRRWYLEHLVFAVHLNAFSLLVATVVTGLYAAAGNPDPPAPAAESALNVWGALLLLMAYRGSRTLYGQGRARSALKAVGLAFAYSTSVALAFFGIVSATLWLVY